MYMNTVPPAKHYICPWGTVVYSAGITRTVFYLVRECVCVCVCVCVWVCVCVCAFYRACLYAFVHFKYV